MTLAGSTTILNVQELHETGAPGRWMFSDTMSRQTIG